jgi:hypothetical protein
MHFWILDLAVRFLTQVKGDKEKICLLNKWNDSIFKLFGLKIIITNIDIILTLNMNKMHDVTNYDLWWNFNFVMKEILK